MEVRQSKITTLASTGRIPHTNEIIGCSSLDRAHNTIMAGNYCFDKGNVKVRFSRMACLNEQIANLLSCSYYCFGPSKPPIEMSINEMVSWNQHIQTPVLFNHHEPVEVNESTIKHVDLNPIKSTQRAVSNQERVLILTPLRDASYYLPKYFDLLVELTYPHDLIDLAFLVGDSTDDTLAVLSSELDRIQKMPDSTPFHSATIIEKDFGKVVDMNVQEKHGFEAQGPRRKAIGRARNYLLYSALKPEHSWVYWRDVDIVDSPKKILEDFVAHDKDILVPSMYCSAEYSVMQLMFDQISGSTGTRTGKTLKGNVCLSRTDWW